MATHAFPTLILFAILLVSHFSSFVHSTDLLNAPPRLPRAPQYAIHKTSTPPPLNGDPRTGEWVTATWTRSLSPIIGPDPSTASQHPDARVKMLWDDDFLYVGAWLDETHIVATITETNTPIFHDNDFEIFLDPSGTGTNYYEYEVNALGTTWQLSLDRPYSQGGSAKDPHELAGLMSKVHVDGTLNDASDTDVGWGVTVALPMKELKQFGAEVPVKRGTVWRMNFSRVQWEHKVVDGKYERVPPIGESPQQGENEWHPEQNLVWAPTGVVDIHRPSFWGFVLFEE